MRSKERIQAVLDGINLRQVQKHLGKGMYEVGNWEMSVNPDDYMLKVGSPQLYAVRREVVLHLPDGVTVTIEKEVTEWKK